MVPRGFYGTVVRAQRFHELHVEVGRKLVLRRGVHLGWPDRQVPGQLKTSSVRPPTQQYLLPAAVSVFLSIGLRMQSWEYPFSLWTFVVIIATENPVALYHWFDYNYRHDNDDERQSDRLQADPPPETNT